MCFGKKSSSVDMASLYSSPAIKVGELRLIKILRVEPQIVCELGSCSFEDVKGSYLALSYEWGPEVPDDEMIAITINGFDFKIRPNLGAALRSLYNHILGEPESRAIWIDAICLNQDDKAEKSVQLPEMGNIYSKAQAALGFLGPATNDSAAAMQQIKDSVASGTLPEAGGHIWGKIRELLQRKYFRRLWIWQESVLPTGLLLFSGDKSITWDDFYGFIDIVRTTGNMQFELQDANELASRQSILFSLKRIQDYRDSYHKPDWNGEDLPALLQTFRDREVREPVDRLWGSLALWKPYLVKEIKKLGWIKNEAKDHRRFWETYILFGKNMVRWQPTLMYLSLAASVDKHPKVPSWCPDWHTRQAYDSFAGTRWFMAGYDDLEACRSNITTVLESDNPDSKSHEIEVPGTLVDHVDTVADGNWSWSHINEEQVAAARRLLTWEETCLQLAQATYNSGDDVPLEHARTLISECFDARMVHAQHDVRPEYRRWIENLRRIRDGDNTQWDDTIRYSKAVEGACKGRKYFTTRGGRVGLGPPDVRSGDQVVAFDSAGSLFVIREKLKPDVWQDLFDGPVTWPLVFKWWRGRKLFRLVGDAYVCGLMTKPDVERCKLEPHRRFTLV